MGRSNDIRDAVRGVDDQVKGFSTGGIDMPWQAAAAGITGLSSILSGKNQSRSASRAADITAQATRDAAASRAQSDAEQLKYLRGEGRLTRRLAEADRAANFRQWDVNESNLQNIRRDNLLNTYAMNRSQGLTNVDLANAAARNTRSMFEAGREDENLMLARKDDRMSNLGAMLGSPRRDPLTFDELAAFREAQWVNPGAPKITPRERIAYSPAYDPNEPDLV
jgi:hypothetical protein